MVHKIALNGFGQIGKMVYAGADCITVANVKSKNSNSLTDLSLITEKINNKILVDEYRKVQHKYYREKDLYKIKEKI